MKEHCGRLQIILAGHVGFELHLHSAPVALALESAALCQALNGKRRWWKGVGARIASPPPPCWELVSTPPHSRLEILLFYEGIPRSSPPYYFLGDVFDFFAKEAWVLPLGMNHLNLIDKQIVKMGVFPKLQGVKTNIFETTDHQLDFQHVHSMTDWFAERDSDFFVELANPFYQANNQWIIVVLSMGGMDYITPP